MKDQPVAEELIAFSNGIRLSIRQWIGLAVFGVVFVVAAPSVWERIETFSVEPDYRIPHDLSNDYWLYARYARVAGEQGDAVVIGDSVVWGEYVTPEATLSHYLNQHLAGKRFANLGLGGAHQLALTGLVTHYASAVKDTTVVLQCNPLWMSSARRDLRDDSAEEFNHPRLIPRFSPRVPRYREEISGRLSVLVEQRFPFNQWTNHLQQVYYDRSPIPAWTIAHPYDNPVQPLTRGLPALDRQRRTEELPWYKTGNAKVDFAWFEQRDQSLQLQAFKEVAEVLKRRGNRVFVLVGPLNEHMLADESLKRYQKVKTWIKDWLEEQQIAYVIPPPLASEQYGDMSHPLAAGYEALARQLAREPFLQKAP